MKRIFWREIDSSFLLQSEENLWDQKGKRNGKGKKEVREREGIRVIETVCWVYMIRD